MIGEPDVTPGYTDFACMALAAQIEDRRRRGGVVPGSAEASSSSSSWSPGCSGRHAIVDLAAGGGPPVVHQFPLVAVSELGDATLAEHVVGEAQGHGAGFV